MSDMSRISDRAEVRTLGPRIFLSTLSVQTFAYLPSLQEALQFLFSLETHCGVVFQIVDIPFQTCLHESVFLHTKLAEPRSSHKWLYRETTNFFHTSWPRAPLNVPLTGLSAFQGCCSHHKLLISSFLSTWLLCHCGTQMWKKWRDDRLSNLLLSLGSLQHQMLLVTWEITLTIVTYQVQGQSKFSASAAKIEVFSSCLNNL